MTRPNGGFKTKELRQEYYRIWNAENPEKVKKYKRKWYLANLDERRKHSRNYSKKNPHVRRNWRARNPEKVKSQNRKDRYGITDEQFKSLLKQQKNRCAICRQKETAVDKKTGKVKVLCVDHNHKTKEIRKLLCWRCNLGIGIFRDDWVLLQTASDYLKTNEGTR